MKPHLMFIDRDFNPEIEPCFNKDILSADLELATIFETMAQDDKVIAKTCEVALFTPLYTNDAIKYRQDILRDCLNNQTIIRELYQLTIEVENEIKQSWYWLSTSYELASNFACAVEFLKIDIKALKALHELAISKGDLFQSLGMQNLFKMFIEELNDNYLLDAESLLDELLKNNEMLISAKLGDNLNGVNYVLRHKSHKSDWVQWRFAPSYTIAECDESGSKDLHMRIDRAINEPTNALAQAAEHLESFFKLLRQEIGFYVGCLNLYNQLNELGLSTCLPEMLDYSKNNRMFQGLYDVSLALLKQNHVIGNDLQTENKLLYLITGANQGGKSTFLRSVGQAQLMAQCGMFVPAKKCAIPLRLGIFTHFKKEEDATMTSGKLDEELDRMDHLIKHIEPHTLMLMNESFASTNEHEGSDICFGITKALIEDTIEVFSVTHLYTYAATFANDKRAIYLRSERLEDGSRTFKIKEGKPLKTAYGIDLYHEIFDK